MANAPVFPRSAERIDANSRHASGKGAIIAGRPVAAARRAPLPLAFALAVALCCPSATVRAADAPPTPVGTVRAELRPVDRQMSFVGRVEAPERVEIRARVKGFLEAVLFKDGERIAEGAPLYRIEKDQFEAEVQQAQGALERAEAALALAKLQRQRAEDLLAKNVGSVVARDQAVASESEAKGAVLSAQANLKTAQINLAYTDITAPIAGRIGRTAATKGHIVGPDSGALTLIVSTDPMYVTFPISQRDYLKAQKSGRSEDLSSVQVRISFPDGSVYGEVGKIDFIDVSVDRTTDTVIVRAVMPNPKGELTDGQLVQVQLQVGEPEKRVLVPQAALIADQKGVYVFVVEDGKAVVKRLTTGAEVGGDVTVESGLSGGELVVVDGLQTLRPGMTVLASPSTGVRSAE